MSLSDGQKHDLALVVCDKLTCLGRSEFRRCYENEYIKCPYYTLRPHNYSEADLREYRRIKKLK